jgi:tellurite resistance protein TerC
MPSGNVIMWSGFGVFVLAMLALDLFVFHREAKKVSMKEALAWACVWVSLALVFNVIVYFWRGSQTGLEFLTGYLIEESLSVDNLFVFLMIFSYFSVPAEYQHKTLFLGILGALIMRLLFIVAGVTLIERFHWIIYVFGAFLVFTGIKMAFQSETEVHPERNPVLRLFRRLFPVTKDYEGDHFVVRRDGRLLATPLLVVLVVIETTDIVFALDSIPAVLAITRDPFVVYTSNVFAILGLRAIYFALAGFMEMFHYLHYGLSFILVFVGVKMVISEMYKMPIGIALGVVAAALTLSILASIRFPRH